MNLPANRKNRNKLTETLAELVCEKKCGLQNSLYLISRNQTGKNKVITQAAENIYNSLLNGLAFSNALKLCPFIEFDLLYISFIRFAERSGNLEKTLLFLKQRGRREQENISKVVEACVYPAFVIVLSIVAGCFLVSYSKQIQQTNPQFFDSNQTFYSSILFASCF